MANAGGPWADQVAAMAGITPIGLTAYRRSMGRIPAPGGHEVTEPVTRLLTSWAGLRTFSPDRTLVLGPDTAAASFIWCAGQGGYGMQSNPAAGQLLADLANETTPTIDAGAVAALHPARFS